MMSNLIPDCEKCPLPLPGDFAHTRTQGWLRKEESSPSIKQGYPLSSTLCGDRFGRYMLKCLPSFAMSNYTYATSSFRK